MTCRGLCASWAQAKQLDGEIGEALAAAVEDGVANAAAKALALAGQAAIAVDEDSVVVGLLLLVDASIEAREALHVIGHWRAEGRAA